MLGGTAVAGIAAIGAGVLVAEGNGVAVGAGAGVGVGAGVRAETREGWSKHLRVRACKLAGHMLARVTCDLYCTYILSASLALSHLTCHNVKSKACTCCIQLRMYNTT